MSYNYLKITSFEGGNYMYYGYARVSTKEQNLDRQKQPLKAMGIKEQNIYSDKLSGENFERPQYIKLMKKLKEGDVLVIKSIDRLGRNYNEILEQWRILTKDKAVDVVVLDMPLLDTRQGKDLMGTFISDLVLQILSYVADMERKIIKQRQAEGIAIAKAKGVKFGRPPKNIPENFDFYKQQFKDRQISSRKAADKCGIPQSTFLYWVNKYQ